MTGRCTTSRPTETDVRPKDFPSTDTDDDDRSARSGQTPIGARRLRTLDLHKHCNSVDFGRCGLWRTVHGEQIPTIGVGWEPSNRRRRVGDCEYGTDALEIGYRHIDTAEHYDNQSEIGNAIANSSVDRGRTLPDDESLENES